MTQSSKEIKAKRIKVLGKEFGSLFDSVFNEFLWIYTNWHEYKVLFATKESRIEILNKAAPYFFSFVQRILVDNILLGISKLTDPPKTGGNRNASVTTLIEFISEDEFKSEVDTKTQVLLDSAILIRDWRNRRISHSDYLLATDETAKPLVEVNRDHLDEVFKHFEELLNLYQNHYFKSHSAFGMFDSNKSSIALLRILDEGIEAKENRMKKLQSKDFSPENFRRKDI